MCMEEVRVDERLYDGVRRKRRKAPGDGWISHCLSADGKGKMQSGLPGTYRMFASSDTLVPDLGEDVQRRVGGDPVGCCVADVS